GRELREVGVAASTSHSHGEELMRSRTGALKPR
ncbi:unnamed protein product, partial [Urochloa humidicola]